MMDKRGDALDIEASRSTIEDDEVGPLLEVDVGNPQQKSTSPRQTIVTSIGLQVLILLAVQNCSKNILMRYVMKDNPGFLTSAAVISVQIVKLLLSALYIVFVERSSLASIISFLREDYRNTLILGAPAAAYSLQMSLEYVALANLNAASFSVLVQTKVLATAFFAAVVLQTKLNHIQILSLVLLTTGVMLCNLNKMGDSSIENTSMDAQTKKGIMACLGIALSSGFASVYTEKVIKAPRDSTVTRKTYSLAYMQVQLALVSLAVIGLYAFFMDWKAIQSKGLWHNFTLGAFVSIFNGAIGGLIVAAVLKYADSVLKGYATAISVVLTGMMSTILFGTQLNTIYVMGIVNVVIAVLLYNSKN